MFKTMSEKTQNLIVEALNRATTKLSSFNVDIASVMGDDCEPFQVINDKVIDSIDRVIELFTDEDSNPEELNGYAKMISLKALNEYIQDLEKSMAYFIQFHVEIEIQTMVLSYQEKIQALYEAQIEFNIANN